MNETVKNICKIGQGHDCCRYLVMGDFSYTLNGMARIDAVYYLLETERV